MKESSCGDVNDDMDRLACGAFPDMSGPRPTRSTDSVLDRMPDDDIRLAARVNVPVLVTAENRGHRDLCARLIHATSACMRGPFVTYSTDGVAVLGPSDADDSGDHTPLRRQFDCARGGTLFIDDLTTLTADAQSQLLSLLDERLEPPAATIGPFSSRVRVIAGSSRHFDQDCWNGGFLEQLYYRLNVIHLVLTY